ncbi:MAG: hypothetical protein HXS53_08105 [Theionarchaea archaeon]|nr:hypothetical protein [Theionarchaea archaeon]
MMECSRNQSLSRRCVASLTDRCDRDSGHSPCQKMARRSIIHPLRFRWFMMQRNEMKRKTLSSERLTR